MRELQLTDAEIQKLVAPALNKRLKAAGFKTGTPSNDHLAFFFPVNLNLAGHVTVTRDEDGTWFIRQEDAAIADRVATSMLTHFAAINTANAKHGT